jgi:hypothetical protein
LDFCITLQRQNQNTLKNQLIHTLVTALLLIGFSSCNSKERPADLLQKNELPSHPRILLLAGEETGIKQTISGDADWNKVHLFIISESNKILTDRKSVV